eukprot:437641_1
MSLVQQACIISSLFFTISIALTWQGLDWTIKSGTGGPGPNNWASNNVWIDKNNNLHLNITYDSTTKKWSCAELYTNNALSFGTYQWWVVSSLEFDQNVVLGLFFYEGPDGVNEIDIEFSKWSQPNNKNNADYNVYPATNGNKNTAILWNIKLNDGTYSTQRMVWNQQYIEYWAIGGHYNITQTVNVMEHWKFAPNDWKNLVPQENMRLHMNFWLVGGKPPSDQQPVEVILSGLQRV